MKQTPLHYAILQYNMPVVTLLLGQELDLPLLNSCIELAEKTAQRDQRAMQLQLIKRCVGCLETVDTRQIWVYFVCGSNMVIDSYCELDATRKDADGPAERKASENQKGSTVRSHFLYRAQPAFATCLRTAARLDGCAAHFR